MLHAVVAGAVAGEAPAAPHHARHPSLGRELREKLGIEIHSTGSLEISSQDFYNFFKEIKIYILFIAIKISCDFCLGRCGE